MTKWKGLFVQRTLPCIKCGGESKYTIPFGGERDKKPVCEYCIDKYMYFAKEKITEKYYNEYQS